ncbi:MAG: NAD-binding protein [Blastocatellia bacterium]
MNTSADILIYGASHTGMRLAARLAGAGHRVVLQDRAERPTEQPAGWEYARGDFTVPDNVEQMRVVYAVSDEDRLNIRMALAVRRVSPRVPIVITLTQSRLGKKLTRHLAHFSYINPPQLAAKRFVDAIDAPAAEPAQTGKATQAEPVTPDEEPATPWKPDPLIIRAVCFIGAMAALATVYFHLAERMSWLDALYFVVTLMATVGFGDFSLREATPLSKIVGILLMIASVTNTAVIFALISDSLLKKRLALSFGRRRVNMSDHVIVAGAGSVGSQVVEELLRRGQSVVVIDSQENGRFMPLIFGRRLPVVIGDGRQERTLTDAGVSTARALLSVTNDDLTNLEIGLNARGLAPRKRVVLRIYDQELAQSLREQLDIHFAFSMSAIAAEILAQYAE